MPYNGSGVFSLTTGNPVVTGTVISSTWANNTLADIANNGLTNALTKDGQQTPTANIPLGGFRLTGAGDGVNAQDAVTVAQLQKGGPSTLASVSGSDTITASTVPAIAAYAAGQRFQFIATGTNTTSAVTLNLDALGAKSITRQGANNLVPGDIASGQMVTVVYDGTQFQMANPVAQNGSYGQCRLIVSSVTTLTLQPYNGNCILINGAQQEIPSSGVVYTVTGLSTNTTYYVYAWMNAGVMTLELSTTGHATNATTGIEQKSGDPTRSLVGMVRTNAATQFSDSASNRLCLNWFNRRVRSLLGSSATNNTASTTPVNVGNTVNFLAWSETEGMSFLSANAFSNTAQGTVQLGIFLNGVVTSSQALTTSPAIAQIFNSNPMLNFGTLAEGFYQLIPAGNAGASSGTVTITNALFGFIFG